MAHAHHKVQRPNIRSVVNHTETLSPDEILQKLPTEYQDFVDVFDRTKADVLPPNRP